jgi:hypothetical protein
MNVDREATQEELNSFLLKNARQEKLDDIKEQYINAINKDTADINNMSFSIHDEAQQNLTSTVLMAKTFNTDITYFEKNGTQHTFTFEEFLPISAAIANAIQGYKSKLYSLETQTNNASTLEALNSIKW